MPSRLEYVLTGIKGLSESEKEKVLDILKLKLEKKIALDENTLAKTLDVSMGPVTSGCPCCGR